VPRNGGNLTFDLYVANLETTPVDYDAWLEIAFEGARPPTVVLRSFTNFQPGWTVNRPGMWYPFPSTLCDGQLHLRR